MIDVKLRLFIPAPVAQIPLPVVGDVGFGGDNRGFSYDGGTHRAELWIDADNSPFSANPITVKNRVFGQSSMYHKDRLSDVLGKPFWWKAIRRDPFLHIEAPPDRTGTAAVTEESLRVSGRIDAGPTLLPIPNLRVNFHVNGVLPLDLLAPPINCDLELLLTASGTNIFAYSLNGSHDGFPAYELYVQRRLIYSYDPVSAGGSPLNLALVGDIPVNVPSTGFVS